MVVRRKVKPLFIILVMAALLMIGVGFTWMYLAGPVESGNKEEIEIVIPSGANSSQIGSLLKENGLIRNEMFFKIYLKFYSTGSLKASTYTFHKGMSLSEIVSCLESGNSYNPDQIRITFREGERITDYAKAISQSTNHEYDEILAIFKDREYTKKLIEKYWFLTDTILDSSIYYPLEGYLAPDTYYFENKEVTVEAIIETLLSEMDVRLSEYTKDASKVHYYMTMASIVELEGTNTENRKMIAGVFENRLASGMNLGSDVTTYYGLQVPMNRDLTVEEFQKANAYNTRSTSMIGKMPIGPICNSSKSSIEAAFQPIENDYFFFVADKNGVIYFTKTNKEHEEKVAEIKANGDWIW